MATNEILLRDVDQFMADYVPVYNPLYPLLLGKSEQYASEVGKIDFRRLEAVGDLEAKRISPKDTEIHQVLASEGKKSYKKYFNATQFTFSEIQTREQSEEVVKQVLDAHQVQFDKMVMFGDGTSNGNQINNGLYFSSDANYVIENSVEVDIDDKQNSLYSKVMETFEDADQIAGKKAVLFFGDNMTQIYHGLFAETSQPFKKVLGEALGADVAHMAVPRACKPATDLGWMIVNLDQVKMHYCKLPALHSQGFNQEKMYYWHNFLQSSAMIECLMYGAIIRQPATIA